MTVSEMDTRLSQLLGDPDSRRWTQTDHRLPALNIAQNQLVMGILGFSAINKSIFDLLLGIQASKSISVDTTGYALSGLHPTPGRMFTEVGFMRASVTLDGNYHYCVRYTPDMQGLSQNTYLKGSNEYPVIRFENDYVYVDVTTNYYPATVILYYIREPKELVISSSGTYDTATCELSTALHQLIIKMAEAECRRMGDDFEQYSLLSKDNTSLMQSMVQGSIGSIKFDKVGQYLR